MQGFDFSRCRGYPFTPTASMVSGFNKSGETVYYQGPNGSGRTWDHTAIKKAGISEGTPLTIKRVLVGDWSSDYEFVEFEGRFNTVCFAERKPYVAAEVTQKDQSVYVVSVDDHPTGVFSSREAVTSYFPELKFEEINPGFWKALSKDQYNTVYVERFIVQHS